MIGYRGGRRRDSVRDPVLYNDRVKHQGLVLPVASILFFAPSALLGQGMLLLGPLGASVGWGLVQGSVILGGQVLGFASGEWRGEIHDDVKVLVDVAQQLIDALDPRVVQLVTGVQP